MLRLIPATHEWTCGRSRFLVLHAGLAEGFDGGEEACSAGRAAGGAVLFDLTAGSVVPDTALMQKRGEYWFPKC